MEEDEDMDIAAAMGFASFGGTKKRKFDHTNSPKAKADASGANSTQLGVRSKNIADTKPGEVDAAVKEPIPYNAQSKAKSSQKPQAALGLAAFLARANTLPGKPPGLQQADPAPPLDDQSATRLISFGGPSISRAELNALRNGVRNDNGDTAYFLPSFVEDPWATLRRTVT